MNISALNTQMLLLFSVLAIGFLTAKLGLLKKEAGRHLADLVVNITCPATTLYAVATSSRSLPNSDVLRILLITAATYGALIGFATAATALFRVPQHQRGIYRFMLIFANVGFLGYPVLQALLGPDGVFVASMYNLVFQLLCFTYGVGQISGKAREAGMWKRFCSPMICASVLALVLYLTGSVFPARVVDVLGLLDRVTAPVSMLVIGCSLAAFPLKEIFRKWRVYVWCLLKLVVIPVAVWAVLRLCRVEGLLLEVMVVLAALPVATNATLLCAKYDGDEATAASGVFLSTALCMITLPLLLGILF